MLSSEKIRACIKASPFRFEEIAVALDISERSLYRKLHDDILTIKEINTLMQLLNIKITEFEKE